MITGSLPPASIHGTWSENVEIWSVDDETLMDLTGVTEITLRLCESTQFSFTEMRLTMTHGDITIPSPGIVQWRAEVGHMRSLAPKLYQVLLIFESDGDTIPLYLGTISIVG